jgi:AcrR family transcriptional regulator
MGRASLSAAEVEAFRERLVEGATHLFARYGFEGVTLRGIAAEVGCSPMTPYRYFPDKASIFAAVRTAAYQAFAGAQEACVDPDAPPAEVLSALGRAYVDFAMERPEAYRLMFELAQPDAAEYPDLVVAAARSFAPLREAVGRAVEAGDLDGDPDILAHVFWAGVHGVASLHLAGKLAYGRDTSEIVDPMMKTLFQGNRPGSD